MKGIIYCIECNDTGDKYIGSTTQKLSYRIREHRSDVNKYDKGTKDKKCTSYSIIKNGNYKYYPLEELDINERRELGIRERHFIENTKCVNIVIPTRSSSEGMKAYYIKNREVILHSGKKVIECDCGKSYTLHNKARHLSSQYHKDNYIANLKS